MTRHAHRLWVLRQSWGTWLGGLAFAAGLLGQPASAPPTPAPGPARDRERTPNRSRQVDYSAFRVIAERNIFNAARSGGRVAAPSREARRPARVDTLAVVGLMSYETRAYAFFDGSSSDFRKAVPLGGTVAGFKVVDIRPDRVQLEAGTNQFELKVGARLRREEQGPWQVSESTEPLPATSLGNSDSADASGSNGAANEVLKRLLQRREQETR